MKNHLPQSNWRSTALRYGNNHHPKRMLREMAKQIDSEIKYGAVTLKHNEELRSSLYSNTGESLSRIGGSIVVPAYSHSKELLYQRINWRDLALMFPSILRQSGQRPISHHFSLSPTMLKNQMIFALSPLLVLGYILATAFESDEQESRKRNKKSDFNMEGHSE